MNDQIFLLFSSFSYSIIILLMEMNPFNITILINLVSTYFNFSINHHESHIFTLHETCVVLWHFPFYFFYTDSFSKRFGGGGVQGKHKFYNLNLKLNIWEELSMFALKKWFAEKTLE